jgi:two-component system response regulator NreC
MAKIRILLADDHNVVRTGIRAVLDAESDMQVVAEARNGREAVEKALGLRPDIVVMDLGMPLMDGFTATQEIKQEQSEIRVIALTVHDNEEYLFQFLQAGGAGYILKEAAAEELVNAVRAVHQGKAVLHPSATKTLIQGYLQAASGNGPAHPLTHREREVLKLIAEGHTNQEIADFLKRSVRTIEAHRSHIMGKLGLDTLSDLIRYAIRHGIIEL